MTDRAVEMERSGREIIHLGVGDPDFDTPADIVSAAVASLENGRTHYSPIPGEIDLRVVDGVGVVVGPGLLDEFRVARQMIYI